MAGGEASSLNVDVQLDKRFLNRVLLSMITSHRKEQAASCDVN